MALAQNNVNMIFCRFGTTDSVVHESVELVCKAILSALHGIVKFPSTDEECGLMADHFARRNGENHMSKLFGFTYAMNTITCIHPT